MTSEVVEFWRLVGEGIAMSFRRARQFEFRSDAGGWLVFSGEPYVDFNCALVMSGPDAEKDIDRAVTEFRNGHVPFLVCILGGADQSADYLNSLELKCAGPLPLMVYRPLRAPAEHPGHGLTVRDAASPHDFRLDADLAERSFGLASSAISRVMPFDAPADNRMKTILAFRDGDLAASVTVTSHDGGSGIWSLKTRPELRRQGIGWEMMRQAILRIRAENDFPVFLVSTPEGKPLYDRLGFETIDIGTVWTGTP